MQEIIKRAKELLTNHAVERVLGWKRQDLPYDPEPAFFTTVESLDDLVYDGFCGANLSKYMIAAGKEEGKTLVFLKPCDTYSYNQLLKEYRVERENAYIIGLDCKGTLSVEAMHAQGAKGILSVEEKEDQVLVHTLYGDHVMDYDKVVLERCSVCKGSRHMVYDELMETGRRLTNTPGNRFVQIEAIEAMSPNERFALWQEELSKCIRCNACRNVCPACSCNQCVFDSSKFDTASKVNADSFEEKMFHLIRAFHVAGRCTDCGECSRVCPQGIPLHLLNRKLIKDINEFYGPFQAGEENDSPSPLTSYRLEDVEPGAVGKRG